MASKRLSNSVWVKKVIGFGRNNKAIDENSSYMQEIIAKDIQNSVLFLS